METPSLGAITIPAVNQTKLAARSTGVASGRRSSNWTSGDAPVPSSPPGEGGGAISFTGETASSLEFIPGIMKAAVALVDAPARECP
jgi:hypothetical protein